MYLRNIHVRNIGPLEKLDLELELREDLNPKHVILVGKNGSGKTYTLSYIADSFFELAKSEYQDAVKAQTSTFSPYFKIVSGNDINTKTINKSAAAYLRYQNDHNSAEIHYCEKIGQIDSARDLLNLYSNKININEGDGGDDKKIFTQTKDIKSLFSNTIVFFPSFRKVVPHWLNLKAPTEELFDIETKYGGNLGKEIMCVDTFQKNIQWMLDVILDSALLPAELDYIANQGERQLVINNKHAINNAYRNINTIFKIVLDNEEIFLKTGLRNQSSSRLSIHDRNGIVVPTLEQLSTGQLVLLNFFITIIRHADLKNLNNSIHLNNIEGIVVVDEIDTHLHTKHQSEILPKLIKLFPKIQFIMTSHSPLFVLGMEKEFGSDNVQLIDLPSGMNITSERFGEFEESFNFYKNTSTFEEALHQKIQETKKPLILVEGETDVKYLKKALQIFKKTDLLNQIEIEEAGISEKGGSKNSGQDCLRKGFEFLVANKNTFNRKVLFLFDCDINNFKEQKEGHLFKIKTPQNDSNKIVLSGVENLLPENLFTENFYSKEVKNTGDGGRTTIEKLKKQEFCNYVCSLDDERVFEKYKDLMFPIIEEFLA